MWVTWIEPIVIGVIGWTAQNIILIVIVVAVTATVIIWLLAYSAKAKAKEKQAILARKHDQGLIEAGYQKIGEERKKKLVSVGLTDIPLDEIKLGELSEGGFKKYAEQLVIKKEDEERNLKIGSDRKRELDSLGIKNTEDLDLISLGNLGLEDYNRLRDGLKSKMVEEGRKRKESEMEVSIALIKVKKCKSEELEGLNEEQKRYLSGKWEKEIHQLFEAGNTSDEIISYLCGKENARIKTRRVTNDKIQVKSRDKFQRVVETIENYSTSRIIRDERELESVIYEHLRTIFPQPQYNVGYQKKLPKGRVDIDIDDEIAIELKIADNRGNLNQLFAQIEWYKDEYKHLILVILDLDRVPDIDDFVQKFKNKGVTVIILSEENVRFKRGK